MRAGPSLLLLSLSAVFFAGCPGCGDEPGPPFEPEPQAWTRLCDGLAGDACIDDGPFRCQQDGPPLARCEVCGCDGGAACVDGGDNSVDARKVCADADVRDLARDAAVVRDDLDDDDYLAIFAVAKDGVGLSVAAREILDKPGTDGRTRLVVVGRVEGDRAGVVLAALGSPREQRIDREIDACLSRENAASNLEVPAFEGGGAELVVDTGDLDTASSAACHFEGSVPGCAFPHRASCYARGGARPQTVLVVDDDVFLPRLDDAMLRSVGRRSRELWDQRLDEIIATIADEMLSRSPRADTTVEGGFEVRVSALDDATFADAYRVSDVYVAWMPRFSFRPAKSISFRALWRDGPTQQFMIAHDVAPGDCAFNVDDNNGDVFVVCTASDGAAVDAVVNEAGVVVDVDRSAP